MLEFASNIKIINRKGKIILINKENGKWLRVSQETYKRIELIVKEGIEQNGLVGEIKDSDKEYIQKKIKDCLDLGLVIVNEECTEIDKTVLVEITNRCNLYCAHCCNSSEKKVDFELSTVEVKKIIDNLIQRHPTRVTLSGGEPMIRDDFFDLIHYLRSNYEGEIILMTNGTLINVDNVSKIVKNVDAINISLDGVDEKSCERIRGVGTYKKVMRAITLIKEKGFDSIILSMVVPDGDIEMQKRFIKLNEDLGTKPLIRGFIELGRGNKNSNLFKKVVKGEKLKDIFSEENFEIEGMKRITPCTCAAGTKKIIVDYRGDIYPCQWFRGEQDKLGNALKYECESLSEGEFPKEVEKYLPDNYEKCQECAVNYFCWPCPGELKEKHKNKKELDLICTKIKPILFKHVWGEELLDES